MKKLLCALLVCYLLIMQVNLTKSVATVENPANLKEFLKGFDEITVRYEYPSMRIAAVNTKGTVLPAGTPIIIQNTETISSNNLTSGSTVNFQVMKDIIVDNKVLIKSGSISTAQVVYAKRKNLIGIAGEITISDFSVNAVDGSYVPLRATLSSKGEDKVGLSAGLGFILCPLFLLMKGEDATIPSGTTKSVYTMADIVINIERL